MKRHEESVRAAVESYGTGPGTLAILVIGSVARGDEREDSDIDLYLLVTEEAFAARPADTLRGFGEPVPGREHVHFDVKVATLDQFRVAVDAANDETRACLLDHRLAWATDEATGAAVLDLAHRIAHPGDPYWHGRLRSIHAKVTLDVFYFLAEGERLGDPLLLHSSAGHVAVGLARFVLARDRILYRGPKYLASLLRTAPSTPPDFVERLEAFIAHPTSEEAGALHAAATSAGGEPFTDPEMLTRYFEDNELHWLTGEVPAEYR